MLMSVRLKAFVLSPVLIISLVSVVALSGAVYVYNYQKSDAAAFQMTHTRQEFFRSDPPVVSASPVLMPVTLEQLSNAEYTHGSTTFRLKNGSIVRPNLTSTGGGQEAYTILPQSFATGNLV